MGREWAPGDVAICRALHGPRDDAEYRMVVEDTEGVRWTLTMRPPTADEPKASPWCRDHIPASGVKFAEWRDIAAVRVLSEGWSE